MSQNNTPDYNDIGKRVEAYCRKYSIPLQHFFEILNDQKVIPMLRGKGMEYNAVLVLQQTLSSAWQVNKLNLAAQPGTPDQDIGLVHRRTGITLIVESKSAVRGSISAGARSRLHKSIPHFKVKCHRSRSNTKLLTQGNDRYTSDDFDIVVTNPSNSLYKGGTIGEDLEVVDDISTLATLYNHYGVEDAADLIVATAGDWRFAVSKEIAEPETKLIPRTPTVYLANDPHWKSLTELEKTVAAIVAERHAEGRRR
jgi:hypothetical protein